VSISFEDLEGAKREITAILPEEVSLVDIPAIKEQFAVIKNADGEAEVAAEGVDETPEVAEVEKEATEAPAIVALLKDFEDSFGARIAELETAIADLRKASADEEVAEEPEEAAAAEPAEEAEAEAASTEEAEVAKSDLNLSQLVAAVSKTIISDLEARGVIAPEANQVEEARKALDESIDSLKTESKTAFETVAKALDGLAGRVESIESQDAGSAQADKPIQKSNNGGNEAGFFSSMLLNGLGGRQ